MKLWMYFIVSVVTLIFLKHLKEEEDPVNQTRAP